MPEGPVRPISPMYAAVFHCRWVAVVSDDDLDFDDDELDGLDDSTVDLGDSDPDPDDENVEETAPAPKPAPTAETNGKLPFFKNWAFFVSLIAAVPAVFLAIAIVSSASEYGGQFNWLMATFAFFTFIVAAFLTVLPILLALGFFIGGKDIPAAAVPSTSKETLADSTIDDDIGDDFEDDELQESGELFDGEGDSLDDDLFDEDDHSDTFQFD